MRLTPDSEVDRSGKSAEYERTSLLGAAPGPGGEVLMLGVIALVLGGLAAVIAALGTVFFVGMRRKSPTVLRSVRRFNRAIMNPRMLVKAGTVGAYASVIHHVGRTTGRAYRTPVVAEPTDDGFVIAVPYGTTANWVKNVLAAGSATIVDEGTSYRVDRPEVVPLASMNEHFSAKDRRAHARFRVDQCVRLRHVDHPDLPAKSAGAVPEASLLKS
jgi:deazaflavin-dependent oxidoreductase (nitroreductase family)